MTFPLVIVTFLYLRFRLADNGCFGLIEIMYSILLFILFVITITFSVIAIFRKRPGYYKRPEPISLTIFLLTILVLIVGFFLGNTLKGRQWIYAEANVQKISSQSLTLRRNGTFRVDMKNADFGCFYSGQYKKHGDTILLEENIIDLTHNLLTSKYILKDSLLLPVNDSKLKKIEFANFIISLK